MNLPTDRRYWIQAAIRWLLTVALLAFAYSETGPWTILLLALLCFGHEANALAWTALTRRRGREP